VPSSNRLIPILLAIAGLVLLAIGVTYVAETAGNLPSFFPGHEVGSSHHHVKHAVAAVALGLGAFVLAWFRSGPRRPSEA
jgi:hypothetical protein